ncbi:UNVERIFIED_CONTAM: hypothetical protein FKN15_045237 [Acipenser sinensis]
MRSIACKSRVRIQAIPLPIEDGSFQGAAHNWPSVARGEGGLGRSGCLGSPRTSDPYSLARRLQACILTMQPPKSYSVGGQRSSRAATGKPAGAWPDYKGRWCALTARNIPANLGNDSWSTRPLKRAPAKPSFFTLWIHIDATRPIVPEDNTDLAAPL